MLIFELSELLFYYGYINKDKSEWFQVALTDIIKEIQKLNTAEQLRLKEFFTKSLAFYSASEPIFKEGPSRNIKIATLAFTVIRITLSDSASILSKQE
jgi:hypothetical protein